MATKKPKSPNKKAMAKGRRSGNVELGPTVVRKIRVPINEKVYAKKESELAQREVDIAKLKRSIAPVQNEIRQLRKVVAGLTVDLENNTEERDEKVKEEFHFNTNEVRVLRASDGKLVEKRTMTAADRKRQTDIEDQRPAPKAKPSNGDSGLTPGEAIAAARAESEVDGLAESDESVLEN
jgi:hypothetical protein